MDSHVHFEYTFHQIIQHLHMCILLNINSNILSNHYIQYYVMIFFRAKASPSKQATVAFPGLNYDITRFASIVRVGNGYCGINIEKNTFRPGQESQPIYRVFG